jgi:magnesium chelatase family protein
LGGFMFTITSSAIVGIEAVPIEVEAHISFGLTQFHIVGLPDTGVKESRERIRAALKQCGFTFPRGRVSINLAPASIRKEGTLYDLPIALAVLIASGQLSRSCLDDTVVLGELSLSGEVRPVFGVLSAAVMTKKAEFTKMFVPVKNAQEAVAVEGVEVFGVSTLTELVDHLLGTKLIDPAVRQKRKRTVKTSCDFTHVKGQELAKRGLEIASAGGHNVLLSGPPGTGKTLLARAFPSILPELSYEESIEATSIASIAGELRPGDGLVHERPFRGPHHSASAVALVGGGTWPKPGEVSLAHRGVLFLDELPEFSRYALEHLRQPLEDGFVTISRSSGTVRFPAQFMLIASMNPCPCGYFSDPTKPCDCTPTQIRRYQKKISGPLLDRFDLIIEVPKLDSKHLLGTEKAEVSSEIRKRVKAARDVQTTRFANETILLNTEIPQATLDDFCLLSSEGKKLVEQALNAHKLTPRGFSRVKKVSRTIADLAGSQRIEVQHVAEALQFREQLSGPKG